MQKLFLNTVMFGATVAYHGLQVVMVGATIYLALKDVEASKLDIEL